MRKPATERTQIRAYQNISAELTAADQKAIKEALALINNKLPFLVVLTAAERRQAVKMGGKSLAFVEAGQSMAQTQPDILPGNFDADGFDQNIALCQALGPIQRELDQLAAKLDDTMLALGSEIMTAGLDVYDYAKKAAKRTPGLKAAVDEMATRFQRIGKSKSAQPDKPNK